MCAAVFYIPQMKNFAARCVAWAIYGYIEGLFFVGLWVFEFQGALKHDVQNKADRNRSLGMNAATWLSLHRGF